MIKKNSPLKNLPKNLDVKQAFFLDAMRHCLEIAELSFSRLKCALEKASIADKDYTKGYANYFLDAWTFVDVIDRLFALWQLQPNSSSIPSPYAPKEIRLKYKDIRKIRNITDHLAQRIDQLVAKNTPTFGELNWCFIQEKEVVLHTYFIRPGIAYGGTKFKITSDDERYFFHDNNIGNITLRSLDTSVNLSSVYIFTVELVSYIEKSLEVEFQKMTCGDARSIPGDLFVSAELDLSQGQKKILKEYIQLKKT